jgi:hypothetical protein
VYTLRTASSGSLGRTTWVPHRQECPGHGGQTAIGQRTHGATACSPGAPPSTRQAHPRRPTRGRGAWRRADRRSAAPGSQLSGPRIGAPGRSRRACRTRGRGHPRRRLGARSDRPRGPRWRRPCRGSCTGPARTSDLPPAMPRPGSGHWSARGTAPAAASPMTRARRAARRTHRPGRPSEASRRHSRWSGERERATAPASTPPPGVSLAGAEPWSPPGSFVPLGRRRRCGPGRPGASVGSVSAMRPSRGA